ncbi:MAG: phosphomannomutase [Parcubacteria bacterium C7867-004]|nr:MAG: phosphomannomutase [Parcubacteria bacterium C7867-004]
MTPRAVLFDLDETLAESKQPITDSMANLLVRLLDATNVAVTSGQKYELVHAHTAGRLPSHANLERLHLLPNCGAGLFLYTDGSWSAGYKNDFSEEEFDSIKAIIEAAMDETGIIDRHSPSYGDRIEHRGPSVALSALGQTAPLEEKLAWDPSHEKRSLLREAIAAKLEGFDVRTGGSTSFDVTRPGIDKAYGVRKLSEHLSIPISDMLYIGDALFPGGNDEVVKTTGIETRATSGPFETARIIEELLER